MDDPIISTLAEAIDELGRRTGAPPDFVATIRAQFTDRGIPLTADAAPFYETLAETFARRAALRDAAQRGQRAAARLKRDLEAVQRLGREQHHRLDEIATSAWRSLHAIEENERRLKRLRYLLAEFYTPLDR